jgi:predicted lipoprotein
MNFHMNDTEKFVAKLHGMLKTTVESIKKKLNRVMMVQKEKKKRKH